MPHPDRPGARQLYAIKPDVEVELERRAERTTSKVPDVGPIEISAPALLSEAADRTDVEQELNAIRDRFNELLAALRQSGCISE